MASETRPEDQKRIPVAYLIIGYENNRKAMIEFYRNSNIMINWVLDASQPEVNLNIDWLEKEAIDVRNRGVRCNTIVDITDENISRCKELANWVNELRHLDGINVITGVSDVEAVAMVPYSGARREWDIQFMHSESESVVRYKQLLFDMLWHKSIPAQSRFNELENAKRSENSRKVSKQNRAIDRLYVCNDCHDVFIFAQEMEDHMKAEGHGSFREYPLT